MKAYGIFDGGGVKGAALAGGLAAAEDQGIEFVGFGGTSAGSMVAFLAAVGYSGKELGDLLVKLDFKKLLDDQGRKLDEVRVDVDEIAQALRGTYLDKLKAALAIRSILAKLDQHGLYEGTELRKFLLSNAKAKLVSLRSHQDITFEDLAEAGCAPLKILASDVTGGRSAVFSRDERQYGASVLDAVRASAGYPFAFRPMQKNGSRLVDGGLASNLPSFLFEKEFRANRLPTFAFDLITPAKEEPVPYRLVDYLRALLDTALEAGDELLRGMSDGVVHVPIKVEGVDTLDFGISAATRRTLYDSGYRQAADFLTGYQPLQIAKAAGNELKRQLMVRYGELKLYQPVLAALARDAQTFSRAKGVRAHIMLPTGRRTLIVVYQFGMDGAPDSSIELPEDAGCSGQAWTTGKMIVADLSRAARDPESLKMTVEDHARIPKNRRSMLSAPIPGIPRGRFATVGAAPDHAPVGVLSIDSTSRLEDTGWAAGHLVDEKIQQVLTSWAYVVSRLLP